MIVRTSLRWVPVVTVVFLVTGAMAWGAVASEDPVAEGDAVAETSAAHAALDGHHREYVGAKDGCRRCHFKEYRSWQKTPHATSLETLPEDKRTDEACVKCHVTGFGEPTGFTSVDETPDLAHVGCEACHGPGSLYKDKDVMKDREKAISMGMVLPDEETCRGCHNEQSPTFEGFDFETAVEEGVHEIER